MNFKSNESLQKLRGGYYTEPRIARYLLRWVLQARPSSILEPSCGDGGFFAVLQEMRSWLPSKIVGVELDKAEATKARELLRTNRLNWEAEVYSGDFLEWTLRRSNTPPDFDAVVGNPPFIRYQYLDQHLQLRAERIIRSHRLPFTKHTNAWVPFVVASLERLRPGGRLAMVVPSELLHVLHAQSARTSLIDLCSRVLVIDPIEIWFDETLQGVVLLLAEKRTPASPKRARVAIARVEGRSFLEGDPSDLFDSAPYVEGDDLPGKWTIALLSHSERRLLNHLGDNPGVARFSTIASASVGIVTGANKFFLVPDSVVDTYDLEDFAYPMFGRSEHVPGVLYNAQVHRQNRKDGLPTNFLWFNGTFRKDLPIGALRYIQSGERAGLHRRYKCRIRDPWYSVPSVFSMPVGMLKRAHDFPRLILNTVGAYTTDTVYRVAPKGVSARGLVFAFVNSLTALCCELEGRHYGGGVLELVPSEIARLLLPIPRSYNGQLGGLDSLCREQASPETVLESQDHALLEPLGLSRARCETLRAAWLKLRNRRQRASL